MDVKNIQRKTIMYRLKKWKVKTKCQKNNKFYLRIIDRKKQQMLTSSIIFTCNLMLCFELSCMDFQWRCLPLHIIMIL